MSANKKISLQKKLERFCKNQEQLKEKFSRPFTLSEKLLLCHLDAFPNSFPIAGLTEVSFQPDRVILPDSSGQMVWLQFLTTGLQSVKVPTTTHCDHLVEASKDEKTDLLVASSENFEIYEFLKKTSEKFGGDFWDAGSGIIHQVALERYGTPGSLMLGTDSHTANAGGLAMLGIGIGGADAVEVMTGSPWKTIWPKTIGVNLTGTLNNWTTPKDIILHIAHLIGVSGATGCIIEFFGTGIKKLSVTGRSTICNMGAELGATSSVFAYDENTSEYLKATGRQEQALLSDQYKNCFTSDIEVFENTALHYEKIISIDLNTLEPQINGPFSPDNGNNISDFAVKVKENKWPNEISAAFIGSCTNSSYEDLARAASIAKQAKEVGLKVKCPLYISPGSESIKKTIKRDGFLEIFQDIGAVVLANACGPCVGMWKREDENRNKNNSIITSFNRNFAGRNDGSIKTHAFLMSPEMVISKALSGELDFNPLVDFLKTNSTTKIKLAPAERKNIPDLGFIIDDSGLISHKEGPFSELGLKIPKSERIKPLEPFEKWNGKDFEKMFIICKSYGKCTTDQISPAGEWLKYRGNLEKISENLLIGVTNTFSEKLGFGINQITKKTEPLPEIAKDYSKHNISWVLIGDSNMGEGSSREHAALEPRYRGCKVVIAKSFARIFETNLKRHGLLALTFENPDDYEELKANDLISIKKLSKIRTGKKVEIQITNAVGTDKKILTNHSLTEEQIAWFKKGGALNYLKSEL